MDVLFVATAWLIILFFLVWVLPIFHLKGLPRWVAFVVFGIKFVCGLALTELYMEQHPDRSAADIYKFYDDSRVIYEALDENPKDFLMLVSGMDGNSPYYDRYYVKMKHWSRKYDNDQRSMSDTRLMIRLNALARVFSTGIYEVHLLFWCFVSLIGLCLLYKGFYTWFTDRPWWLAAVVFMIPSVLCWGSGVLKEGFLLLFAGLLIFPLMRWVSGRSRLFDVMLFVIALSGFYFLKIYVLFAFIPPILSLVIAKLIKYRYQTLVNLSVFLCISLIVLYTPGLDFLHKMAAIQQDMIRMAFYMDAGSVVDVNPLIPQWGGVLRNLPEALLNATLRPGLFEADNNLQLFAALENTLIAIAIVLAIGLYQPIKDPQKKALVWFCLGFTFLLFALTGLTTPILGTLVRYRMPALPFLGIALLLLTDTERLAVIFRKNIWPGQSGQSVVQE